MSTKFTPTAVWRTRASPGPGLPIGTGSDTSTSGPPDLWKRIALGMSQLLSDHERSSMIDCSQDLNRSFSGDAPDFVEVGEAGIAVDDAMRHQRRVQLVG